MRVTRRKLRKQIRNSLTEAREARLLSETVSALAELEAGAKSAKDNLDSGAMKAKSDVGSQGFLSYVARFFESIGFADPCDYIEGNMDELKSEEETLAAAVEEMQKARSAQNANAALSTMTNLLGALGAGSLGYFLLTNWDNYAQQADNKAGGHIGRLGQNVAKFVKGFAESDQTLTDMSLLLEQGAIGFDAITRGGGFPSQNAVRKSVLSRTATQFKRERYRAEKRAKEYARDNPNAPSWKIALMRQPGYEEGRGVNASYAKDNPLDPYMDARKVHPIFQDKNVSPEAAKMAMDLVRRQLEPDEKMRMKLVNQMPTSMIGKMVSGGQDRKSAGGDALDIHPGASGPGEDSAPMEALKHIDNQQYHALQELGEEGKLALKLAVEAGVQEAGQNKFNYDKLQHHDKQTPAEMEKLAKSQLVMTLGREANTDVLGQDATAVPYREPTEAEVLAWRVKNKEWDRDPEDWEIKTRQLDTDKIIDADGDGVPDKLPSGHADTVVKDAVRDPNDKSMSHHEKVYGAPRAGSKKQMDRDRNTVIWRNTQWERVGYTLIIIAAVLFVYRILINAAPGVLCTIKELMVTVASKIGQGLSLAYNKVISPIVDLIKDLASRAWDSMKSMLSDDDTPRLPVAESYRVIKEWNDLNDSVFILSVRSAYIL